MSITPGGVSHIVSQIDGQEYIISTSTRKRKQITTVKSRSGEYVLKEYYYTLPSDIQEIIQSPFTTQLISKLKYHRVESEDVLLTEIAALLNSSRTYIHTREMRTGKTALMYASQTAPYAIPLLKRAGASMRMVDAKGCTALMLAHDDAVDGLLDHFTDYSDYINIRNSDGQTALLLAVLGDNVSRIQSMGRIPGIDVHSVMAYFDQQMSSVQPERVVMVEKLITISGITGLYDIVDPERGTLLMRAIEWGNITIINNILRIPNPHINYQDKNGLTALMLLCRHPSSMTLETMLDVLRILVNVPNIDLNIRDRQGYTALTHFIELESDDTTCFLQTLMYHPRCDISIGTNYGYTALCYVIISGNANRLRMLLRSRKPTGDISVPNWVETMKYSVDVSKLLRDYIQSKIKCEELNPIKQYYYDHFSEQQHLIDINSISRDINDAAQMNIVDDDEEMRTLFETRNESSKNKVSIIRSRRSYNVHPTVPEINTRVISDGLRTVLMRLLDEIDDFIYDDEDDNDHDADMDRLRFLLTVFHPMYTNIFIQDVNMRDVFGRLKKLTYNEDLLRHYDKNHNGSIREIISEYIRISSLYHVPLPRDCTISPMVSEDVRYINPRDKEINIWISGTVPCAVHMNTFERTGIYANSFYCVYSATDVRFCTLLKERDDLDVDEPIRIIISDSFSTKEHRKSLLGLKRVSESTVLLYQLIRLS